MTTTAMDRAPTYLESTELRDWYADKYALAAVRAGRCFVLALVLGLIAAAAIAAIAVLLPLKSIKPLIVTVDSRSGLVVSVQPVENVTSLVEHDAIAQSNLYRYVIARLTYDPAVDLNINYDTVRVMSSPEVGAEFEHEASNSNPASPVNVYKTAATRRVHVTSVTPLSKDIAQIRLSTTERRNGVDAPEQFWVATVRFRFTNTPAAVEDRWVNPLGFQVINYRLDQESAKS
jgi:type IV secretion system protein VirB8